MKTMKLWSSWSQNTKQLIEDCGRVLNSVKLIYLYLGLTHLMFSWTYLWASKSFQILRSSHKYSFQFRCGSDIHQIQFRYSSFYVEGLNPSSMKRSLVFFSPFYSPSFSADTFYHLYTFILS